MKGKRGNGRQREGVRRKVGTGKTEEISREGGMEGLTRGGKEGGRG